MCGRYGRRADKQRMAEWFQTHNTNVFNDPDLAPTYNAAPQSIQPVIRLNSETGEREIALMKWGLWCPIGRKQSDSDTKTINADADKLTTSGMWREPSGRRRCLVPADWFYAAGEMWMAKNSSRLLPSQRRQPVCFRRNLGSGEGQGTPEPVGSFAIVTVDPSEWMAKYHDRMGVILSQRTINDGWRKGKNIPCRSIFSDPIPKKR